MAERSQEEKPIYALLEQGLKDEQNGQVFPARDILKEIRKRINSGGQANDDSIQ